jgi:hypothetical protein
VLDAIEAMIAFAGTQGGLATLGLAASIMLLIRKGGGKVGRRRTD